MRLMVAVASVLLVACSASGGNGTTSLDAGTEITADLGPVPLCTPGAQIACACIGGGASVQVCGVNGTLGPCVCADAGAVPDVGAVPDIGALPDVGRPVTAVIFAHSDSVLYAVSPFTYTLTRVGEFTFPAGDSNNHTMNDVAVGADGALVGNTQDALYRIDTTNASCTLMSTLPDGDFAGLTYLPVGKVPGTTGEVLLGGAASGVLYRIAPSTGQSTRLGQLRRGSTMYTLSGDLVSVAGAGTFATVRASNAASASTDQLASVNTATGELTILGDTRFSRIAGLAYYRNTLYGFTGDGEFIAINIQTGVGTLLAMSMMQFTGAGVSTTTPTLPP